MLNKKYCFKSVLKILRIGVPIGLVFIALHASAAEYVFMPRKTATLQAMIDPPDHSESPNAWLGADVAASIKLNSSTYVWIFGDTLLGRISHHARYVNHLRHNSVAIRFCVLKHCCGFLQKYTQNNDPVFTFNPARQYYWPTAGSQLTTKLFLTGYIVHNSADQPDQESWPNIAGSGFVLVDNPMNQPAQWKYHRHTLANTDAHLNWATAAVVQGDWLYIFGCQTLKTSTTTSNTVLSRIRLSNAEASAWSQMQYWHGGHRWQTKAVEPSNNLAKVPGLPGISEMSLAHNSVLGWYTLQIPALSFDVHLYTARVLTGPWIDQGVLYTVPQPWRPVAKDDVIVYAAKVHPELADNDEIVFTYNINQLDFTALINNLTKEKYGWLYIPQFVVIKYNAVR